ncbi:hypothetical protein NDU88_007132 [Pleurodeles waltl]|uniref:Uncharacterized protein n=1 Tax=Pleurodeles waltl TaxID=8319 RepID=A0AAV7PKE4_PLEWA|nr:hypothetical protein NDU88_007132 [Pleurodeles waltl]
MYSKFVANRFELVTGAYPETIINCFLSISGDETPLHDEKSVACVGALAKPSARSGVNCQCWAPAFLHRVQAADRTRTRAGLSGPLRAAPGIPPRRAF